MPVVDVIRKDKVVATWRVHRGTKVQELVWSVSALFAGCYCNVQVFDQEDHPRRRDLARDFRLVSKRRYIAFVRIK